MVIWLLYQSITLVTAIILIILILLLILLKKKIATVPSITLDIAKTTYDHGEQVDVSGIVYSDIDVPAVGETIALKLTDSAATEFDVGTAQTGPDGKYTASFEVPAAAAPGQASLDAEDEKLGVTATRTFTLSRMRKF